MGVGVGGSDELLACLCSLVDVSKAVLTFLLIV